MLKKTIWKGLTYRIAASLVTLTVAYFVTGSAPIAGIVAGVDFIAKLIIYIIHEELWNYVGRRKM